MHFVVVDISQRRWAINTHEHGMRGATTRHWAQSRSMFPGDGSELLLGALPGRRRYCRRHCRGNRARWNHWNDQQTICFSWTKFIQKMFWVIFAQISNPAFLVILHAGRSAKCQTKLAKPMKKTRGHKICLNSIRNNPLNAWKSWSSFQEASSQETNKKHHPKKSAMVINSLWAAKK